MFSKEANSDSLCEADEKHESHFIVNFIKIQRWGVIRKYARTGINTVFQL